MTEVTYHIVEHDGGFAYKVGDVFSETFPSRQEALEAAQAAAAEQQVPGSTEGIRYQDGRGQWHDETAQGSDRPVARVAEDGRFPSDHLCFPIEPHRERERGAAAAERLRIVRNAGSLRLAMTESSRPEPSGGPRLTRRG